MSTKKKTSTKKTTTTRSTDWKEYFKTALASTTREAMQAYDPVDGDIGLVEEASNAVKLAEKIADIATARNA